MIVPSIKRHVTVSSLSHTDDARSVCITVDAENADVAQGIRSLVPRSTVNVLPDGQHVVAVVVPMYRRIDTAKLLKVLEAVAVVSKTNVQELLVAANTRSGFTTFNRRSAPAVAE